MSQKNYYFTSESVTEGHPDKICDQVSDAILDAILAKESELEASGYVAPAKLDNVRCAVETFVTTGTVIVAGEVRTEAYVDVQKVARETIRRIGYDRAKFGFDCDTCGVLNLIHEQSADIAAGVDDQGMMFGYACDETPVLMPMPHYLASRMAERLAAVRRDGTVDYLRPDGKTQVTVRYEDDKPVEVTAVVVSTQHSDEVEDMGLIKADMVDHVIAPVLNEVGIKWDNADIYVNPTGRFVVGGPMGDTGLTGRKIIVDTYGGMGRVLRQGLHEGRPLGGLRRALGGQEHRRRGPRAQVRDRARLRDRRFSPAVRDGGHLRHRLGRRLRDRGRRRARVRPAPGRDHPRPRPAPPDLREDRGVRPLRARAPRVHLGAPRPCRRASRRRGGARRIGEKFGA